MATVYCFPLLIGRVVYLSSASVVVIDPRAVSPRAGLALSPGLNEAPLCAVVATGRWRARGVRTNIARIKYRR
jgi:hypothetical protein